MLLGSALLGVTDASARAATEPAPYQANASAEGVRISIAAPSFVAVDTLVDGGGPVAQSAVDALGNSQAFASLPYPGDLAATSTGLVAGLSGLPAPPAYPFYVSSSYPATPDAQLTQPGYSLTAKSTELSSDGSTQTGAVTGPRSDASAVGSTMADAATSWDDASQMATARATATADVVNIGGVLRIGQLDARAAVTRGVGAGPKREASFVVNGMTIAGLSVGFSDKGFTFAGTNMPIPDGSAPLAPLANANITVEYLAPIDTADGVISPGLVINQVQELPNAPKMVIRYVFGQMATSAVVPDEHGSAASSRSTRTTITPAQGISRHGNPQVQPAATDLPSPAVGEPIDVAAATPGLQTTHLVQAAASMSPARPAEADTQSLYLILAVGAALAFVSVTTFRVLGVRLRWTS
ncbi:MAG TPA: hypothetical protein VGG09_12310 [Acidimicrobiales bacterium]